MTRTEPAEAVDGRPGEARPDQSPFLGPDSEETPAFSVVLPTKNEEAGIAACLRAIREATGELDEPVEVIVSDSSTDRTPAIARDHGAIVVEPDQPGYGYAYRYAFERARGDVVAMGDADTTYDFRELPALVERLEATDADVVLGSRFGGDIEDGAMPALHRYVGNPLLTAFLNRFYGADVSDAHSGLRVLRRDAIERLSLRSDGMEFASEMIMAASARGMSIEEVPITYHERTGEATLDTFRDGWEHLKFMLVNAPGYLFSIPGAALSSIGAVVMALAYFDVAVTGVLARPIWFGTRSMVAGSLLGIVGFQIVSLGIFATIGTDPIRRPTDRVTTWFVERLRPEAGIAAGVALGAVGTGYALVLIAEWLRRGYEALPAITHDILAFTLIVLGIQTVFGSFFVGSIRSNHERE